MNDPETFIHVTTINSDGTEGRGWAVPVGIWTEIEYAVNAAFRRESYNNWAQIDTYALNTMYHVGKNPRSPTADEIWGYHTIAEKVYGYGYLDNREYPNGYDEYQRFVKLRSELMTSEEIEAEVLAKHSAERQRINEEMQVGGFIYVVAVEGNARMGDYRTTAEFARGYFETLGAARTKARALAKASKSVVRIYENPVNTDFGYKDNFFNRDRMKAEYDGKEMAPAVVDKKAELERLRKIYG